MSMFSSPRVLVIDDEQEEAIPIIRAFSELCIPVAWYTGVGRDVPDPPLPNVRILLLDLVLGTSEFDAKNTAGVVLRTLAPTLKSGPCLFLLWTFHSEQKDAFEQALSAYNDGLPENERVLPLATICLSKSEFIHDGRADGPALVTRIQEELNRLEPINLLLEWEASCAEAAATTSGHLLALAFKWDGGVANWMEKLGNILDELVEVSLGKSASTATSNREYLAALFEPLSLIHEDRTRRVASASNELPWPNLPAGVLNGDLAKAGINHILLAGSAEASDLPGAVLPLLGQEIPGCPFTASGEDPAYQQFLKRIFSANKYDIKKNDILTSAVPVIVELTPACDHAQRKRNVFDLHREFSGR